MSATDAATSGGYAALRGGVGAYRRPVDVVSVSGRDASEYLQGQLSQDVAPLRLHDSASALLLEPDGKLSALVRATRTADDAYVLDTDAGFGETVLVRLRRFKLRTKVDIELLEWPCVALRGAGVAPIAGVSAGASPGAGPPYALEVEWNGTHGVDLLGPGAEDAVPEGATWCDAAAWEALRIEAGIPTMGAELDEKTIAAEAGLVERAVSFTKGCYTGQELVARLDARGNRVARRLCGLVADGLGPDAAAELREATLFVPGADKPVGRVTSAAWSPGLSAVGALCYLHRSVEVPASLEWGSEDGSRPVRGRADARPLPLLT